MVYTNIPNWFLKFLFFTKYANLLITREVEYVPWNSALSGLSHINTMLKRTAAYGQFKK